MPMKIGDPNSNSRAARRVPDMRSGILAGGNWIVDHLKIIDAWPTQDALASILAMPSLPVYSTVYMKIGPSPSAYVLACAWLRHHSSTRDVLPA
jgi:hypothetical protein